MEHTMSTDPVAKFKEIAYARSPASQLAALEGTSDVVPEGGLAATGTAERDHQLQELATHVSNHSVLTVGAAHQVLSTALAPNAVSKPQAVAVANAAMSAAAIPNAELKLTDPVMLWPVARAIFGGVFVLFLAAAGLLTYLLAIRTSPSSSTAATGANTLSAANQVPTTAFVGLIIAAALCFIGTIVLVMGYKSVTISSGSSDKTSGS